VWKFHGISESGVAWYPWLAGAANDLGLIPPLMLAVLPLTDMAVSIGHGESVLEDTEIVKIS
jgi:hypothetical protein